jgi:predicted dehydrogenase
MGTVHYQNYARIEGCQVTALVGITPQSKECAEKWGLPLYATICEMAKAGQVDVVDVCTPTYLHKQHVMEGLSCGLHAITEKPVALRKKDAEEMFALADQVGKELYVAQVLQFTKEVELLRGFVQSGEFGRPLDGFFERLASRPDWAQNGWLFDPEKSGLLPFDLHIHDLDMIVSLFGTPDSYEYTSCAGNERGYAEHYRFLYRYPRLNIAAEAAWFNADIPFTARWRVYFENALVVNDGTGLVVYQAGRSPLVLKPEDEPKIPTGINLPPTGMFFRELTHFMDCIRKGIPSEKVSRRQVLSVVGLLEDITQNPATSREKSNK